MHFLKEKKNSWYVHTANGEMVKDQKCTRREY